MPRCSACGWSITCPEGMGCGVIVVDGTDDFVMICGSKPKIEVNRGDGKTVEMTLEDFIANYTPKNKIGLETKMSFNCVNLNSSLLAQVLQKISPNEITVSERIANKKLNLTLTNTPLSEIVNSAGLR